MAEPGNIDERWVQGTTSRFRVQVYNPRDMQNEPLAAWQDFWCTFKTAHDDADAAALFQLNYPEDIAIVAGDDTQIEVTIPDSATIGASWNGKTTRGYLDVKGRDPDAQPWSLVRGRGTVLAAGTRAA